MEHEPTAAPGERGEVTSLAEQPLDLVLVQWQRALWWSGVRPMLRRMVEANLTMAESLVLRSLRVGPMTVAAAAAHLRLSHSAASRAIDRLVRDGYIAREEDPDDRRQKRLTLAPQGVALVLALEGDIAAGFHRLLADMSADDREAMRALMARTLIARAERLASTGCPHGQESTPITAADADRERAPFSPAPDYPGYR
jgi:DNA-binding MarR family transcriptional regulator